MAETDLIIAAQTTLLEPTRVDGQVGPLTTNEDGRLRVVSKPGYFVPTTGAINTAAQTLAADVTSASNVVLHLKNTGTVPMAAGVFIFEGSIDSTDGTDGTWFTLQAVRSDSNTIETGRAASSLTNGTGQAYAWELSVNAVRWFRIRCTTTVTANSIATWTIIRGSYATEPVPAVPTHAVSISGTPVFTPNTAVSVLSNVSLASTNAVSVKTSAGSLFEVTISNPTATAAAVKFYNKASAPTVGTDVPILTVPLAAGQTVAMEFGAVGKRFSAGIALAITALAAASDTGVAVAGIQTSGTYI